LDALCEDVLKETVNQHLLFKTVTVKIRYQGFETHTRSKTLPFLTNRLGDLQKTANELLFANLRKDRKVRLIGVRVSSLVSGEKQRTLV
jgi:DNA polymerase IV (archaeal DinB-like DNA polymerase)